MDKKKELREQYKTRKVIGGVYRILNKENDKFYLQSTDDIQGTRNWFSFACATGDCSLPPIQEDWKRFGKEAFEIEELDLLEKKDEQTATEFKADIKVLFELWDEKFSAENRY